MASAVRGPSGPFPGLPHTGYLGYPVGTVVFYGPDCSNVTKILAAVVSEGGTAQSARRWFGAGVDRDTRVQAEVRDFFAAHPAQSIIYSDGIVGCPHEEGVDYPEGGACPFCPYWAGRSVRGGGQDRTAARVVTGFLYFAREQWGRWIETAADRSEWKPAWEEWRDETWEKVRVLRAQGCDVRWEKIDIDSFLEWCSKEKVGNDKASRTRYLTQLLGGHGL